MLSIETKKILARQIADHEGKESKPYKDTVGIWTVGIGRNLKRLFTKDEELVVFGSNPKYNYEQLVSALNKKPLTDIQMEYLFMKDLDEHAEKLYKDLPWIRSLDEVRQCVLINMAFNLGNAGLLKFKNTLKAVEEGRYSDAANGMANSTWAKQVKRRAVDLCEQMKTGKFASKYLK